MDIKKIFNLIISDFIKYIDGEKHTIRLGRYKDKIAVIDKGFRLFLIDEKQFPFKLDICGELLQCEKVIPNESNYEDARYTNTLISLEDCTVVIIEGASGGSAWVDTNLLKEYGKNLEFRTAKKEPEKKAVLIYRGDTLLGMVMPVRQSTNK